MWSKPMTLFKWKEEKTDFYTVDVPNQNIVPVKIEKAHKDAIIPTYAHSDDACCDLYTVENYIIPIGAKRLMRTGIAIEIPSGYEVQIRPRSGLAVKQGLSILNAPGTVDAQYRNEIMVLGINLGHKKIAINKGDRIAQMCIKPVYKMVFEEVNKLSDSDRGLGGWGSTGE
jgi:dUTP pyrophosphatase